VPVEGDLVYGEEYYINKKKNMDIHKIVLFKFDYCLKPIAYIVL
jgi:hypothetical protein